MPLKNNKVVIAAAGSRKTTSLVDHACAHPEKRVLITTYTNENVEQIKTIFRKVHGLVPPNVTVLSWYSFLLQHGVRPYQKAVTKRPRIESIYFDNIPSSARRIPKRSPDRYYLTSSGRIFRDRVAEFVCHANIVSAGAVIRRLERVFDMICIDEIQDCAGYDLDLIGLLFQSSVEVRAVGDPRQGTFSTNQSRKNSRYRQAGIFEWVALKAREGLCTVEERAECYRSNQQICDFADGIFPEFPRATAVTREVTGHDGIFQVPSPEVMDYVQRYAPVALRYNRRANTLGPPAFNIGSVKGRTYDRVLIFPTKPMLRYLQTKDPDQAGDRAKLYVAVTRAKYSVAFVVPG